MSNNTKKKQEEKHLKILRDFLSLSPNKTCFDCNQRGPTYVNTTIGSFVCISCSGKLRGLTPPHRVKSISMASFTPEEIEFLKSRGNEYCRLVWMAHYNTAELSSETKDDQKFKDHLMAKYEKKRWYADPSTLADRLPVAKLNGMNGETSQPTTTTTHSSVTSSPVARPVVSAITSVPLSSVPISKTSDLLADLDFFIPATGSASSAFSSPRKNLSSLPQSISQPSFANFQNADFFFSETSPQKTIAVPAVTHQVQTGAVNGITSPPKVGALNVNVAPAEDRYSALKDLDAMFTTQATPAVSEPTVLAASPNWNPSWNAGTAQAAAPPTHCEPVFSNNAVEAPGAWSSSFTSSTSNPNNPFLAVASVPTQPGTQPVHYGMPALPWANFSSSPLSSSTNVTSGTNIFPAPTATAGANSHFGFGFGGHPNPMVGVATTLSTSQSLDLSPKMWGTTTGMNPFMDTASFTQGRSHNPFL